MKQVKVSSWDGPNKRLARARKLALINRAVKKGWLKKPIVALTFAGQKAHFEKALVTRQLSKPSDIVTIQSSGKVGGHDGAPILRSLIKVRDKSLPGMAIWPHTFASFSKLYKKDNLHLPPFKNTYPTWYKSTTFRGEMESFLSHQTREFNVIDADICGSFSKENGGNIIALMQNKVVADRGFIFVNHCKGRDIRSGMVQFFEEYFDSCPYVDIDNVIDADGIRLNLRDNNWDTYWWARYTLTPLYYVCAAFEAGYLMEVERLVEYRDLNEDSKRGITMLQWYFKFQKLRCHAAFDAGKMSKFVKLLKIERGLLQQQIDLIIKEAYPRTEAID